MLLAKAFTLEYIFRDSNGTNTQNKSKLDFHFRDFVYKCKGVEVAKLMYNYRLEVAL